MGDAGESGRRGGDEASGEERGDSCPLGTVAAEDDEERRAAARKSVIQPVNVEP
jgi:hypothetical protein